MKKIIEAVHQKCAVLGSPITHSKSPLLHRTAYQFLGLDWTYEGIEVRQGDLANFISQRTPEWRGFSLTMPLKEEAIHIADRVDDLAILVSGANTLTRIANGWRASNTDVTGFSRIFQGCEPFQRVALLGGGATARAALAAIAPMDVDVEVYLRTPGRESNLRLAFSATHRGTLRFFEWSKLSDALSADLLINTTPVGGADGLTTLTNLLATKGLPQQFIDVLYADWPTPIAALFQQAGSRVVSGLELLVHQAVAQLDLMIDGSFDQDVMTQVLLNKARQE